MLYNKNIVLEMISNSFWEEIETFVEEKVIDCESKKLMNIFAQSVDYALFNSIESISILTFNTIEKEKNENIFGTLQVVALIEGYTCQDDENVWLKDKEIHMRMAFSFDVADETCSNLILS